MAKSDTKTKTAAKASKSTKHKAASKKPGGNLKLKPGEQKILDIVAGLKRALGKEEAPRKQVFAMAGLGKSTFANALTTLKNGLLIVTPDTLTITESGEQRANPDELGGDIAMNNQDHLENTKTHYKLKPKACALLDELADGQVKKTKEVASKIGMKINSTFANLKTDLKKKEIIVFDRDTIQLHDGMFPFGRPE